VLGRQELGDVLAVLVEELADPKEELRATRERDGAPGIEGAPGRLDGAVDLLGRSEVDLARLDAERGVLDGAATARLALDPLPVDPVRDPRDLAGALLGELIRNLGHAGLLGQRPA